MQTKAKTPVYRPVCPLFRDATGNVMCIYRQNGDTLRATERYLYGSKRLGVLEQQVWITANSTWLQDSNTIGARVYEFTDHLGNVTYTAQDRKHLVQDSYGQWQFIPFAVTYTDYYPFGFPMPGRSFIWGHIGTSSTGRRLIMRCLVKGDFRTMDSVCMTLAWQDFLGLIRLRKTTLCSHRFQCKTKH